MYMLDISSSYIFLYSTNCVLYHIKVCLPSTALYRVIFVFRPPCLLYHSLLRGSHSLPHKLPGVHTDPPSHSRQYLFYHLAYLVQHSLTHSLMADRRMVVGQVPMDPMCSFMGTNHVDMTAHNPTFL